VTQPVAVGYEGVDQVLAAALGIEVEDVPYEQLRRPDRSSAIHWTPEARVGCRQELISSQTLTDAAAPLE
jgi:hypothetical protein